MYIQLDYAAHVNQHLHTLMPSAVRNFLRYRGPTKSTPVYVSGGSGLTLNGDGGRYGASSKFWHRTHPLMIDPVLGSNLCQTPFFTR